MRLTNFSGQPPLNWCFGFVLRLKRTNYTINSGPLLSLVNKMVNSELFSHSKNATEFLGSLDLVFR